MMFIIRSGAARPDAASVEIKHSRRAPSYLPDAAGGTDFFCLGDADAVAALRSAGWQVIELHDGYYEDGQGGGVAIWGQGRYWEIRDTPFTVKEAVGPAAQGEAAAGESEHVNVRRAIFGA